MIKKVLFIVIIITMVIGCNIIDDNPVDKSLNDYKAYYNSIEDNDYFNYESNYYSLSAEMIALSNGSYSYYIFLDNPQVAMYDIRILAIDLENDYETNETMAASIGIFEDEKYSLIPHQVNSESGFYKGLMLSGQTTKSEINLGLLVSWYSNDREKSHREFIKITLNQEGIVIPHDEITGDGN